MLSGPFFGVAASVAGLGALVVMLADYGTIFVPPEEQQTPVECLGYDGMLQSVQPFEDWERSWLTRELTRAGEPSLYLDAMERRRSGRIVRFTWLRSFGPTVVVRVDYQPDGSARLLAYQADHYSGQPPNGPSRRMTRSLTSAERTHLDRLFETRNPMETRAVSCGTPPDGAPWVLETVSGRDYRVVNQPQPGEAVRETGLYLLSLTSWEYPGIPAEAFWALALPPSP